MKKMMMIAVMAVMCLTANAQKMRHGAGQITIQPMVGFSVGTFRGLHYDRLALSFCSFEIRAVGLGVEEC